MTHRVAASLLAAAALWDAAALALPAESRLPQLSHGGITAGSALMFLALLVHVVRRRRRARTVAVELAAGGVLLLAWVLRGHPGIPPDAPIVVAQAAAAAVILWCALRTRRTPRHTAP